MSRGTGWLCAATLFSTFVLVVLGGLVTSEDASLAIPDWPLNWGRLIPPMAGGIRYAFAHRVAAACVTVLVGVLALQVRSFFAWSAAAAVAAQAALGGAMVRLADPRWSSVAHASLAELCFGLVVGVAVGSWLGSETIGWRGGLAAAAIFVQTVLGAGVRHDAFGVTAHLMFAVVATGLVMWVGLETWIRYMNVDRVRQAAVALLGLTGLQVFLGLAAFVVRASAAHDPQPMPLTIWTTVAHQTTGSLLFGSTIALAMIVYWHEKPKSDLSDGEMAVA